MVELIHEDTEYNYRLYKTSLIANNLPILKYQAKATNEKFHKIFGKFSDSSTWGYKMYNFFQISAGSVLFYKLYEDIRHVALEYLKDVPDQEYKWINSWINYHKEDEVLNWHNHIGSYCHGYVSIDPKNSTTEFEGYDIKNEPGLIYIGPSLRKHRVNVHEPFKGERITIAFDIAIGQKSSDSNLGYIPLT